MVMLHGRGWGCTTELLGLLLGHFSLKDNQNCNEIVTSAVLAGRRVPGGASASVWSWVWGRKEKGGDLNVGMEFRADFFWFPFLCFFFVLPFLALGTLSMKMQEFPVLAVME